MPVRSLQSFGVDVGHYNRAPRLVLFHHVVEEEEVFRLDIQYSNTSYAHILYTHGEQHFLFRLR